MSYTLLITALLSVLVFGKYDTEKIKGNGDVQQETRSLNTFTKIVDDGTLNLIISASSGSHDIELNGDSNILPLIKTEVNNGTLHIWTEQSFSCKSKLSAHISCALLQGIEANGTGDIKASGVKTDNMSIEANGTSSMVLEGSVSDLKIDLNGTGDIHAKEFSAQKTTVRVAGTGNALVNPGSGSLDVVISGTGNVLYAGTPSGIKARVHGTGRCARL